MTTPLPFTMRDAAMLQNAIGDIVFQLIGAFDHAERIWQQVAAARADGSLAQPPFSFTGDQIAYLDRLTSDLHSLRRVAYGETDQQGSYNFLDVPSRETAFR